MSGQNNITLITRDGVEVCPGQVWHSNSQARPGLHLVLELRGGKAIMSGKPEREIPVSRMHKGRLGWELVSQPSEDFRRLKPLVGQLVILVRGSGARSTGPGQFRRVTARLDGIGLNRVWATLMEDDAMATTPPFKSGEQGVWHGYSFVESPAPANGGQHAPAP